MGTLQSSLRVSVIDGATGKLRLISGALGRFQAQNRGMMAPLGGTIGRLAAFGGAYLGVTSGIRGTFGAAREMQSQLTEIGIKSDMSKTQLGALRQEMMSLSPKVNQTTSELLSGVDAMVTLGLDAKSAAAAMPAVGKAATATMSSISDLSAASVAAMQNMRVAPSEIGRMLDSMASAGNAGAFEMRDMAREFPALTASAKALGMEGVDGITDMAAALQIARRGAGDASTAANNMANFMQKLMVPQTIKNFKKFGVDVTKELQKAHKKGISPIEHFIKLVDEKTKGGKADLVAQLFGDKQVLEFLRPMLADFKDYIKIREDAERSSGTVADAYAKRMQDAEQKIKSFRIQVGNLGTTLGGKLLGPVGDFAEKFAHILDTLDKRVGVFDPIRAGMEGLTGGLGLGPGGLGKWLEESIFGKEFAGSSKDVDERVVGLAKLSNRMRDIGKNIRSFAEDVAGNPVAKFVADMAGSGFKLMLASAGIGILAGAIWKLGRAVAFLSGLTTAVSIIKGLAKVGGLLAGGGAEATVAKTATKGGGASAATAGAKKAGSAGARWLAGKSVQDIVASGRQSSKLTVFEQLGKATGKFGAAAGLLGRGASRLLGLPAVVAEVTARALIDKGPADERFIDPNYSVWALRDAENRAAQRETTPAPDPSEPKPFSLAQFWKDLTKPIKPGVGPAERTIVPNLPAAVPASPAEPVPFSLGQMLKDLMAPIGGKEGSPSNVNVLGVPAVAIPGPVTTRPSGVQDVRMTNPPPRPNVTINAPITVNGITDLDAIGRHLNSKLKEAMSGIQADMGYAVGL